MKKKQGYLDRMDESLGMRRGKEATKAQSYRSRRSEEEGLRKAFKEKPMGLKHNPGKKKK